MALYDPNDPNSEDPTLPTAPAPQVEPAPQPQVAQIPAGAPPLGPAGGMTAVADASAAPAAAAPTEGPAKPVEPVRVTDAQAKKLPAKAFDAYKDPDLLNKLAVTYLSNGFPEGVAFLAHAHQAVMNGQAEAVQRLLAGDPKNAIEAMNRSGGNNYDATDATKNKDGTWTIAHSDGSSTIMDPHQELASLLSPEQFLQNEQHKAELNAKIKLNAAQIEQETQRGGYYKAQADYTRDQRGDIARDAAQARRDAAQARATAAQQAAIIRSTPQMLAEERRRATAAAAADAENKYSILTTFNEITKQYRSGAAPAPNGDDGKPLEPAEAAARELTRTNGAIPMQDPQDPNHIVLVDPAGKKAIFDFGTKAEYKRITGREFVARAPPAAAAASPAQRPAMPSQGPPRAPPLPGAASAAPSPYAGGLDPQQAF